TTVPPGDRLPKSTPPAKVIATNTCGHSSTRLRALPADDDLLLVGDGEVVDHFADQVRAEDERHAHHRRAAVEKSGPLTGRPLLARLRAFAGSPAGRTLPR